MPNKIFILCLLIGIISNTYNACASADTVDVYLSKYSGEERLEALAKVAYEVASINPQKSIALSNEILESNYSDSFRYRGISNFIKGEVYYLKKDYSKAIDYFNKSLPDVLQARDNYYMSEIYHKLGLIYFDKYNFKQANYYFQSCIELQKLRGDRKGEAVCYHNIGKIYNELNNTEKKKSYFNKALKIYEEIEDVKAIADVSLDLGYIAVGNEEFGKGNDYYQIALRKYEDLNDTGNVAKVMNNLGELNLKIENNFNALGYFKKAKDLFSGLGERTGLIKSLFGLGDVYTIMGNEEEAVSMYKKGEIVNRDLDLVDEKMANLMDLYKAYKNVNNLKDAVPLLEEYYALKDSVFNENKNGRILELENKYNSQKKRNKIAQLESRNRAYVIVILVFVFMLLGLSGYGIFYIRTRKLQGKQRLLELEQKVLRTQMNPHFIFNSLAAVQCYVLESKTFDAVDFLADFAGLMRLVLQYSQDEYISLEQEREILDYYINLQNRRFGDKINYEIIVDESLDTSRVLIPPMLAQPFIENSFEHGDLPKKENGKILVRFKKEGKKLSYRIEDNGVGIYTKMRANEESNFTKKHKSLALKITKERLNLINNGQNKSKVGLKLEDRTKYGEEGTRVEFTIPLMVQSN